jgi:HAD superfamily hydrolase (TIGR01509 family)
MTFRYFFWDYDGTLYDSYGRVARACVNALRSLGAAASFDQAYRAVKKSLDTCWSVYAAPLGVEREAFREAYQLFSEREGAESMRPYPGVRETLEAVIGHGGRNYLYTHRGESAFRWLEHDGLRPLFSDFVTSLDGFPGKPAPDALNYLVEKHRLDRARCVMLGDRDIDLDAGKNAGMACALFDPEHFYDAYDTPYRFADRDTLRRVLVVEADA